MQENLAYNAFNPNAAGTFEQTVRKRVNAYFSKHKLQRYATGKVHVKTLMLFGSYLGLYLILVFCPWIPAPLAWMGWGIMGILLGLLGMNVLHDKVHGSYSEHRWVKVLLEIPILFIGAESRIWHIEHDLIHHNYTNIDGIDQDINPRYFFRFSPTQKKRWFHRFQAYYAPLLYGLLLFEWLTIKDFLKVLQYRRQGWLSAKEAPLLFLHLFLKKTFFHLVFLGIPLYFGLSGLEVLLKYMLMLTVGGMFMTLVFQLAHVTNNVQFGVEQHASTQQNWHLFQLETTHNFAVKSTWLTSMLGGLNHQIEHHLFPDISHVHYEKIAPLVKETAEAFGYPYHCYETLFEAVTNHFRYLNRMGAS